MINDRYELPDRALPGHSVADTLADIFELREILKSIEIETANTRIERYHRYYDYLHSGKRESAGKIFSRDAKQYIKSPLDCEMYVLREIHELLWIMRGVKQRMPNGARGKLEQIVSGRDFSASDACTSARNIQFELRIASYFCQDGYDVDIATESDIVATKGEDTFLLECKRVSSSKHFVRRIIEARQQIERRAERGIHGIVAVDTSNIAFPHKGLVWGLTNEHTRDIIQDKHVSIWQGFDQRKIFSLSSSIIAVWLQIHMPALIRYPRQIVARLSSFIADNPLMNRSQRNAYDRFTYTSEIGYRNAMREKPARKLKLRESVVLPAGTTLAWDEHLLASLLETGKLDARQPEDVVLKMRLGGEEHLFFFQEMYELLPHLDRPQLTELSTDPLALRFFLACQLFGQRYPYEDEGITECL